MDGRVEGRVVKEGGKEREGGKVREMDGWEAKQKVRSEETVYLVLSIVVGS